MATWMVAVLAFGGSVGLASAASPSHLPVSSSALGGTVHPADDSHPSPFVWSNGVISLRFGGEQPAFYVSSLQSGQTNVSVSVVALAEVNASTQVVALAPLNEAEHPWTLGWSNVSGGGVVVTLNVSAPVFAADGAWNSTSLPSPSDPPLGNAPVRLTFHLSPSTGTSAWSVKFDLGAQGWPWVSSGDGLGLALRVQAVSSTEISPDPGHDGVTEGESGNGTPVASLTWGPNATVTYPSGSTANALVSAQVQVSQDQQSSDARLLFTGVAGGYGSIYYDPTVTLNAHAFPGAGPVAWLLSTDGLLALIVGTVLVAVLAASAWKARSEQPSEPQLASSRPALPSSGSRGLGLCRRCGGPLHIPVGPGVRILSCERCQRI